MEASASAFSNEANDHSLLKKILKKIQTILEEQSSSTESEIGILRKEIADNIASEPQLGIVTYFSLFPQGYVFDDAERLIHLWIAERFCNSSEDGCRCLSHLLGSSILQDVKKDEFGPVRRFKMHQQMRNIAKSVDSSGKNITNPTEINVDSNTDLRASFDSSNSQVPEELYSKTDQLRSIFFFNTDGLPEGKLNLKTIFKKFKNLCVLDLRNLGIECVPKSIGDLKALKYLDLSQNNMKKLPSSIAELSMLHTLKLSGCTSLQELPKDLKKLKHLCVLDLRNLGIECVPKSIGDLKDLKYLDLSQNNMKKLPSSIAELSMLHTLKLSGCTSLKELPKDLKKLEKLKHLDMEGCRGLTGMPPDMSKLSSLQTLSAFVCFQGPSLPDCWLASFKSLVKLSLKDCHGCTFKYLSKQDDKLPNLKILELVNLKHLEYITQKCNKEAGFYNSLEEMTIKDCPMLKSWWEDETVESHRPLFDKISKLHVHRCPLQTMPLYPHLHEEMVLHSCTLELLRLNTMSIPLKNLLIQDCSDLTNLSGVFQHLSSLQCLTIENCRANNSLEGESQAWEGLKSLGFLRLKRFSNLSSLSFGDGVTTLKELTIENCDNLTSISDIGTLTSLQELTLRSCGKLTSISDSEGQVTSLRSLEISNCKDLKSLPKTIFKSLRTLRIFDCKLLQPMFVENTGDYWSLIVHIPDRQVKKTLQG